MEYLKLTATRREYMATSTIKNSYASNAGMLNNFLSCKYIGVDKSATKNISFAPNTRCFVVACASSNAHKGAWIVASASNGDMSKVDVVTAGNVSLDVSTSGTLKVTNGSSTNAVYLTFFVFNGSVA